MYSELIGFALILFTGSALAVFTAASVRIVGVLVAWLLGPNDWFCKAIQIVSHGCAFITFLVYEIHGFSHLIH
jgi:hypothetical protein